MLSLIITIASLFVFGSHHSSVDSDEGLEERSYLKPVKDKLTFCPTTGHTIASYSSLLTPALATSSRVLMLVMQTQRTQRHYS